MLICTQGNPEATIKTIDSYLPYVDEVVIGDVMVFDADRQKIVDHYEGSDKVFVQLLPFNHLFEHGFARTFNKLAAIAKHDFILLMGVGNVLDKWYGIDFTQAANMWAYQRNDGMLCHTFYDRRELELTYCIHEEVTPRPGHSITWDNNAVFDMLDEPKDVEKMHVYNDIKEIVYLEQYRKIFTGEDTSNPGWVKWVRHNWPVLEAALKTKGKRLEAFKSGGLEKYLFNTRYIRDTKILANLS